MSNPPRSPAPLRTENGESSSLRPVVTSTGALSIAILKDVLDSTDALPVVKAVAGVGIKIIEVVNAVRSNKQAFQNLALRAQNMIVAVADACRDAGEDVVGAQLEKELQHFTSVMDEMLEFAKTQLQRNYLRRILYKDEDAENIKVLEDKLDQAFKVFGVQSHISLRSAQRLMAQRIDELHDSTSEALVMDCPLSIPEGVYMIRNSSTGNVLELENGSRRTGWVPVYTALHRDLPEEEADLSQLWSITSLPNQALSYVVRSLATGTTLELLYGRAESGACVGCHPYNGGAFQHWEFFGSRRHRTHDLCTIRSCVFSRTVLDSQCPVTDHCELAHTVTLDSSTTTQEWSLIYVSIPLSIRPSPFTMPPPYSGSASSQSLVPLSPRTFYLQAASSDLFMTRTGAPRGRNVHLKSNPTTASLWYFHYYPNKDDTISSAISALFSIVAISPEVSSQTTLTHWDHAHVCTAAKYTPYDGHHQWEPIPRGDGLFSFKNRSSGALLSEGSGKVVHTIEGDEADDPACLWRVIHPDMLSTDGQRVQCPVVYDSALSFPPASLLVNGLPSPPQSASEPSAVLVPLSRPMSIDSDLPRLRVRPAAKSLQSGFMMAMEKEHDVLAELLESGYTTFVLVPQHILATKKTKDGRSRSTALRLMDEKNMLNPRTYRQSGREGHGCF